MTQADRVLSIARGELGRTELPAGSNNTPYGAAYGLQGQPWCMIFLWWVFREANLGPLFYGGQKTASCGALLRWAQREGLTVPVEKVKPGDIVILNFHGTKDTEHCGIVETMLAAGSFVTIEGNTATGTTGSQDNGGIVALKTRYASQVVGVIRPKYDTQDWLGRWSTPYIQEAMNAGVLEGYPDGTFKPAQAVTREELAAFWYKMMEAGK